LLPGHVQRPLVVLGNGAIVVSRDDEVTNQKGARVVRTFVEGENMFEEPDRLVLASCKVEEIAGGARAPLQEERAALLAYLRKL